METFFKIAAQSYSRDFEGGTEADNSHIVQSSLVDNRLESRTVNIKLES